MSTLRYPPPALPTIDFYILLCLARQSRLHGYALKQRVLDASLGSIVLGDGTIYPAIKRLHKTGLVSLSDPSPLSTSLSRPRHCYDITVDGEIRLRQELRRLQHAVAIGRATGHIAKPDQGDPALADFWYRFT